MKTEQEHLRAVLQSAYPAAEPSEALRQRIETLAVGPVPARFQERKQRRKIGLRLAFVMVTAVVILAFLLLTPRLTAVYAFQRMTDSLRAVRSAHIVEWEARSNGSLAKSREIWYQAGSWRVEEINKQSRTVQVCRYGKRWTYNTLTNRMTQDKAAFPDGFEWSGTIFMDQRLHDITAADNRIHVTLLGAAAVAGRPAHILLLDGQWLNDTSKRSRILVDDASDLPIRWETQTRELVGSPWKTVMIREEEYNQKLSESVFATDFPKTAQIVDGDADREYWRKRLDKGIAAQKFGHRAFDIHYRFPDLREEDTVVRHPATVVLRDFQVNAKGDVFLLFTANSAVGRDIPFGTAELTDDLGTKYLDPSGQKRSRLDYIPTCIDPIKSGLKVSGFLFHNEQTEGMWWVPLQTQGVWKPRHFRMTLHLGHEGVDGKPSTVVFDLPVRRPETANLPGYMPYMGRPLSAPYLGSEEAVTRAYFYQHDAHDLPQALAWYQRTIDFNSATERKFGFQPYNAYEWFDVYQVLMEMGRIKDAKAALLRAKADDDRALSPTETRAWIREALQKLSQKP